MVMSSTGRSVRGKHLPISEINVTPMVDVMLVLLIVFMITAPLLSQGVPVDLPDSAARSLSDDARPIEVSIDQNGAIFIGDTEINEAELIVRLKAISANRKDAIIYIRGDEANSYGRVMEVIGAINGAGFRRVALITERQQ